MHKHKKEYKKPHHSDKQVRRDEEDEERFNEVLREAVLDEAQSDIDDLDG